MEEKEEKVEVTLDSNDPTENFDSEKVDIENITAEEEREQEKAKEDYDASDIQVLEGLAPVRMRPGMYIGTTSERGLHHLVREIVDNAVDESLAGYCKNITVTLNKDGSVTVTDDGRGIPCNIVAKTGKSGVETVYTVLHAGGKFEGSNGYKVSGGLHGVGASVVNALSSWVEVVVYREGKVHKIRFENGGNVVGNGLEIVGDCPITKTGTTVTFKADPTIFTQTTVYQYSEIRDYLRQTAYLNAGLSLTLTDVRDEEPVSETFCYAGGIKEYVAYINGGKETVFDDVLYFDGKAEDIFVEAAFQPTKSSIFNMRSFCNNICTAGGICTGLSQNVADLCLNDVTKAMIENSEFLIIMKQKTGAVDVIRDQLDLSDEMIKYVTRESRSGRGLIRSGCITVPFDLTVEDKSELFNLGVIKHDFHTINAGR